MIANDENEMTKMRICKNKFSSLGHASLIEQTLSLFTLSPIYSHNKDGQSSSLEDDYTS